MDKEQAAIERLREASAMSFQIYGKPLIVTTSGGKDSSVCVALAQRAGIPFEVMHNHTTADAPETAEAAPEAEEVVPFPHNGRRAGNRVFYAGRISQA